jgi:hypothetical protein
MARSGDDGHLDMFGVTVNGSVWHTWQLTANTTNWVVGADPGFTIPGVSATQVAATTITGGVNVYAVSNTGELWKRSKGASGWNSWFKTLSPSVRLAKIAATRQADGTVVLFAIDHDRRVWAGVDSSSSISWALLDTGRVTRMSQIAACLDANNVVQVVGVDHTGRLWVRRQTSANAPVSGYTAWSALQGETLRPDVPVWKDSSYVGDQTYVPNLVGYPDAWLQGNIDSACLVRGTTTYVVQEGATTGIVLSQSPQGNSSVPKGTRVDFTESQRGVRVPNIVGMTIAAAQTALSNAGLQLGNETDHSTTNCDILNKVSGQNPKYQDLVPEGTAVNYDTWVLQTGAVCR